jgi:uncharacterized protein YecT (DUF1311 family)
MVRFCFIRHAVLIFLFNLTPALTLSMVVAAADDGVKSPSQVEMEKRERTSELNSHSNKIDDDFIADLTETYAKAMEAEANIAKAMEAERNINPSLRCHLYFCYQERRLEALRQSQSAFMTYRYLDCHIVARRLLVWSDVTSPGCISERTKARTQHLRDHYQLQPDPKPLSEGEQSWSRTSWSEAQERFIAVEKDLTESYAKASEASVYMDPGDDCHDHTCEPQGRCEALRASQFAFMTYRFQHCQVVVPREKQLQRFGGDVAEWRCMAALTRERIEILRDYQVNASKVQAGSRTEGWSLNSSCVVSYDEPSRAKSRARPRARPRAVAVPSSVPACRRKGAVCRVH